MHLSTRTKSCAAGALIFAIGWLSYQPSVRFSENDEYTMTTSERQSLDDYLGSLDEKSLIVSDRADAFLIAPPGVSLYTHMRSDFGGSIIPYKNTRLFFRTPYGGYDGDTLLRLMTEARERNLLVNVDRLVFVRASVTRSAIVYLTLCAQLDKEIIPFSDSLAGHSPTGQEIIDLPAAITSVSTSAFFDQIVSPEGKAHGCLHR